MPDPSEYENEEDWMKVCVPKMMGEGKENDQAVAACMSMWKERGKAENSMKVNLTDLAGESLDSKVNKIRDGFYKKFNSQDSRPMPVEITPYIKEIYDSYVIVEVDRKLYKVEYSNGDDGIVFEDHSKWQAVKVEYVKLAQDFIFVELSVKTEELKMIDGLSAGTFTAMNGREVKFDPEELPEYVANTKAIIESTLTEKGELVGLPIDKNGHDHQGGAGWIVDLELDQTRNVIRLVVKWTKDGIDLIKGNIRRFFSPSTDPTEKVILGGSLTNWPATRDKQGKMLLRPVELSQSIKEIDMDKTLEELQAENEALTAKLAAAEAAKTAEKPEGSPDDNSDVKELGQWMEGNNEGVEELSKRAQAQAELIIRTERRKDKAVEFASRIVGGTKEKPFGLPVKTSRIVKLLLSLPEKQAQEVQELIGLVWKNAIDFAEHGIDGSDYSYKPKLPAELAQVAKLWVDSGKPIKDWFAEMGDAVGKYEDYNLAEFEKSKE